MMIMIIIIIIIIIILVDHDSMLDKMHMQNVEKVGLVATPARAILLAQAHPPRTGTPHGHETCTGVCKESSSFKRILAW